VYPPAAYKRLDSFADAFSHFNSKLLATGKNAAGETSFCLGWSILTDVEIRT